VTAPLTLPVIDGPALDPAGIAVLLSRAAGVAQADAVAWSAEVMKHRVGKRWLIRYTLNTPRAAGAQRRTVVAKLYLKAARAARIYGLMCALHRDVFADAGPLRIPAPLLLAADVGLILQEHIAGADLRAALSGGDAVRPLTLAGRWLSRLHAAGPLPGLPVKSLAHELRKVDDWCEMLAPHLSPREAARLDRARDALRAGAADLAAPALATIHRDFYYANVLWDDESLWVVDFDQMALGDPAQDVGHFLANLVDLGRKTPGSDDAVATASEAFLAGYRAASAFDLPARVSVYRATTYLKLAAKEVERRSGEDWLRSASSLVRRACTELEG